MTTRFIINADDFGFSEGTNKAVRTLAKLGTISSTSIMTNMPFVDEIEDIISCSEALGVGLHVNLTQGAPILSAAQVPTLVDSDGAFFRPMTLAKRAMLAKVSLDEVHAEVGAQIDKARHLVGARLDHWDSHQGVHRFEPLASAIMRACNGRGVQGMRSHLHYFASPATPGSYARADLWRLHRHGVTRFVKEKYYAWMSWRGAQRFVMPDGLLALPGERTSDLLRLITRGADGHEILEIPCHPAVTTDGLWGTSMLDARVDEFSFLASREFQDAIESGRIEPVSFARLAEIREGESHEELAAEFI